MSKKLTTKEFQNKLTEIYGDQFELLSEYINNGAKVTLKCNRCGGIISKRPSKMVTASHEGCYVCSGKNRYKTKTSLQKEVERVFPGEYEILGEYLGARTKTSVRRVRCGHIYDISPDNLLRGKGCPRCSIRQSRYMDIVETYLIEHDITFEKEKRFPLCKHIRSLPFDYYIPSRNTCIEVDGEFHFERNCASLNRQGSYELVAVRDQIKTEFCANAGINLIRLPYYHVEQFATILDKELYANTEITLPISQAEGIVTHRG